MKNQPDEPEDFTNESPSMSELMEVEDAVASTSKSKAQKQREYRQRLAASRTPAQMAAARKAKNERQRKNRLRQAANLTIASGSFKAKTTSSSRSEEESNNVQTRSQRQHAQRQSFTPADQLDEPANLTNEPLFLAIPVPIEVQEAVASTFAMPFAKPITAAPKTRAQIQREYRQRIAASRTPAQVAAAREARNVRERNYRLRQAANLGIASGSLEPTTTSSSRSGQRLNTVHIDTQRHFTYLQRQTLATEPAETTVQPRTSSDQTEVPAQSTWNNKWASSIMRFKSTFLDNDFGYACSVSDRLWVRNDLKPITGAQLKMGRPVKDKIRLRGNHTEDAMRNAVELAKSGFSIRQASQKYKLSYSTVRRYVQQMRKNEGKSIRYTPNYAVNRIFETAEEECLARYITEREKHALSSKDCRRLAFEMSKIINKKIPQSWINLQMAGLDWLRSFKDRHPEVTLRKIEAGNVARDAIFSQEDLESFFGHLKIVTVVREETTNEQDAQPGPSQVQSSTKTRETPGSSKTQDSLNKGSFFQCRFCGDFSKDCSTVDHKPYVTKNKTELVFNDINVSLDFNDDSLPKTVCSHCDAKLQEMHDFVKTVKAAQGALINIGATEKEEDEVETLVVKTEYEETEDDVDKKDGIADSITVGETVFIKVTKTPRKRKSKTDTEPRSEKTETNTMTVSEAKKAKVNKTSQSEEIEDEAMEFIVDIKEEVIEKEDNTTEIEACVKGTDVKPSELELATSVLVYQMGNNEASGLSEGNS